MKTVSLMVTAALACALTGCANEQGPGPVIIALSPERVANDQAQTIEIEGENFFLRIRARFDQPSSSPVRGAFRVS